MRAQSRITASSTAPPAPTASHSAPPAISAVLTTSAYPAANSCGGQRRERLGVDEDRRGLVVGADVVLGLREVDAGLPAVGGVDLRDERRRDLHDRDAALVGRCAEPREVADDAAADGHDVVGARRALVHERAPHRLRGRQGLVLLPRADLDQAGEQRDAPGVELGDVRVADDDPAGRRARSGHGAPSAPAPIQTG